jgi:hypothetical protein
MEQQIKEAFQFLADNPGALSPSEIELIKGFQKHFKEHGDLSERQRMTLFEIRKYRQKKDEHLY